MKPDEPNELPRVDPDHLLWRAVNSLPTGLFICDREGVVRFINEAYAKYLDLRPEDAVGRNITELIPDSRIPGVIASGEAEMGAPRNFHTSGLSLVVNRIPLRDSQKKVIGALSMTLVDTQEQLGRLLQHVDMLDRKVSSYARRMRSAFAARYTVDSLLGDSPAMRSYKAQLMRYARTELPVLLLGATGTGKELSASAIHAASPHAEGPFVGINCATIPKELFESEMLGYAPGAFSGAHKDGKVGQIELANHGTLFLDEIGDLPLPAQAKLLRILEEKNFCRLGSSKVRHVDFRLVAATNRDMAAMISAGTFREDLYYRINPLTLHLPPLTERREDIPLLVRDALDRQGGEDVTCSEAARATLLRYDWPGNVRELRNTINRALSLCQNRRIDVADLPPELRACASGPSAPAPAGLLADAVRDSETQTLLHTLREQGWNVARSARVLGISRATIYEKMHKAGIRRT